MVKFSRFRKGPVKVNNAPSEELRMYGAAMAGVPKGGCLSGNPSVEFPADHEPSSLLLN